MLRPSLVLCVLALSLCVQADRLINMPTGTKILKKTIKFDTIFQQGDWSGKARHSIGFAILDSFDAELVYERFRPRAQAGTFNFSYNYVVPVEDITPGISVGVMDAANRTRDGRMLYFAATFRYSQLGDFNANTPAEATIGAGLGRGLFLGAVLPMTDSFRLIAEHDGLKLQAGFEIRPVKDLYFRWVHAQDRSQMNLGFVQRF